MRIFVVLLLLLAWYFFSWTYIDMRKTQCCNGTSQPGIGVVTDPATQSTRTANDAITASQEDNAVPGDAQQPSATQSDQEEPIASDDTSLTDSSNPGFSWGSAELDTGTAFAAWKQQLANAMGRNSVLDITGLQYADEPDEDLALQRAVALRDALDGVIPASDINLNSRILETDGQDANPFEGYAVEVRERTSEIAEINGKSVIRFSWGTANQALDQELDRFLDRIVEQLEGNDHQVILTGHTDNTSSAAWNQRLGFRRAIAVRALLVQKGIDPDRIEVHSKGEDEPIASNETEQGREQNRRVEVEIVPR